MKMERSDPVQVAVWVRRRSLTSTVELYSCYLLAFQEVYQCYKYKRCSDHDIVRIRVSLPNSEPCSGSTRGKVRW